MFPNSLSCWNLGAGSPQKSPGSHAQTDELLSYDTLAKIQISKEKTLETSASAAGVAHGNSPGKKITFQAFSLFVIFSLVSYNRPFVSPFQTVWWSQRTVSFKCCSTYIHPPAAVRAQIYEMTKDTIPGEHHLNGENRTYGLKNSLLQGCAWVPYYIIRAGFFCYRDWVAPHRLISLCFVCIQERISSLDVCYHVLCMWLSVTGLLYASRVVVFIQFNSKSQQF